MSESYGVDGNIQGVESKFFSEIVFQSISLSRKLLDWLAGIFKRYENCFESLTTTSAHAYYVLAGKRIFIRR